MRGGLGPHPRPRHLKRVRDPDAEGGTRNYLKVVLLVAIFVLLVDIPDFMRVAPKTRLFELGLCRDYYLTHDPSVIDSDGNIAEKLCKVDSVQEDLAMLKGWLNVCEAVAGSRTSLTASTLSSSMA